MKWVIILFIVGFYFPSFAQETWRDTILMARKSYQNKDYGKAYDYYKSVQGSVPEEVDISDEMAQSAYKARSFKDAEEIYTQSNKTSRGGIADKMHNVGNSKMRQKDYAGAVEAYKDALRANPKDQRTRYNLSEALRKLKDQQCKKQKNDKNQQDKNNKQNQQGNNNQQGNQGENGNQPQNQNGQNGQQNQQNNSSGNGNQSSNSGGQTGQLSDRAVDKALDNIMRKEARTKQRMNRGLGSNKSPKSGKDW